MRTNLKRMLCVLMVVLSVFTAAPLSGFVSTQAQATIEAKPFITTAQPKYVKSYEDMLTQIKKDYPNGSYFSANRKRCEHASANSRYPNGSVCSNCNLYGILKSKNIKTSNYSNGYTCYSFASYCFTQCFGKPMSAANYSIVSTANLFKKSDETKYNFFKKAKMGDIIRTSGHYMVFIKCDKNGVTVHDSNYGGVWYCTNGHSRCGKESCAYKGKINHKKGGYTGKVRYATLKYSKVDYSWIQIWHSKNYKETATVNFDANGGTVPMAKQNYEINKTYGMFPIPTRAGYKFTGWYTAKTGGTKITGSSKVTKGNKTLYARWSIVDKNKLYYVEYNKNGGTGSMAGTKEVIANEYFVSGPNKFNRKGYVFKGWNLRRKSDKKWYISSKGWKSDTSIKLANYKKKVFKDNYSYKLDSYWTKGSAKNETFILYAVWSKCTSHKWDAGKVTTAATTLKTGVKTFTCTNCKSTKTQTVAKLTTDSYFSKVYANNIKSNDAKIGAKAKSTAQKKGTGFYLGTSKDSMKRYTKNLKGKGDAAGSYTEIFFTLSGWYGKLKPGTTYYYSIFYLDKNGKECASVIKSFKTSGTTSSTTTTTPAKNVYTYSYNGNGGSGSMGRQAVEINKSFTVRNNAFARSGYTFTGYVVKRDSDGRFFVADKGWRKESEISSNKWSKKLYKPGTSLNVNSSWQNGSKTNETFTFYAQWKKNSCTSHCWDGGKVTTAPTTVKTGINTHTCSECGATTTTVIERSTTEKYFSSVYANSITSTNAKIGAKAKSTAQKKGTGFYLGTSKDSMKRYTKNLKGKGDAAGSYTEIFFPLNNWYGKLKPKTTYYYSIFYLDKNGKECASVIKSFKTK